MFDKWQEIFSTIRKNKMRTVLTGFSVAWGIFILMILLGSGNGLNNGVGANFQGQDINAIWIWGRRTSIPYQGFKDGRKIRLTTEDYDQLKKLEHIDKISVTYGIGDYVYSTKKEYSQYSTVSCYPDYVFIQGYKMKEGRFINNLDVEQNRKVVVLGEDMKKALFREESPIGSFVKIGNIAFQVVGVYEAARELSSSTEGYIPYSTAQKLYNSGNIIHGLSCTTDKISEKESAEIERKIRLQLAEAHKFSPKDTRAVGTYNNLTEYSDTMKTFKAINVFVWLIGIGTLIAGIVGVSNIMLITVKERTKEIGIRKALGATPRSVVSLVLYEAVLITSIAGYVGMVFGIGIMELVNYFMVMNSQVDTSGDNGNVSVFLNPTVDINIAVSAMILLIIAGTLAGYFPAKHAASIKPIAALRDE